MTNTVDVKDWKPNQLAFLFLDELSADVVFACGPDDCSTPEMVPAHKFILSSCSVVFKTMFNGSLPEKPTIRLTDASAEGFKEFLQFFYMDTINPTIENAAEAIYLSKKYELIENLKIYTKFLRRNLTIDQMCEGLELAIRFDIPDLKKNCEQKIITNRWKFFNSREFLSCDANILRTILQWEQLKLHSEEVFNACIQWAKNTWKRQKGTSNEPTLSEVRNQMGDFFGLLEFGSMDCGFIVTTLSTCGDFFTKKDLNEIHNVLAIKYPVKHGDNSDLDCSFVRSLPDFPWHSINEDTILFRVKTAVWLVGYKHAKILRLRGCGCIWLKITKKPSKSDDENDVVLLRQELMLGEEHETTIKAIKIEPQFTYEIRVGYSFGNYMTAKLYKPSSSYSFGSKNVKKLHFEGSSQVIAGLKFKI